MRNGNPLLNRSIAFSAFLIGLLQAPLLWGINYNSAEICTEIHLDAPGQSMEDVPVSDQGDLGICYAHTGCDLASAFLRSKGIRDFRFSPLYTAIELESGRADQVKDPKHFPFLEGGGQVNEVIHFLNSHKCCNALSLSDGSSRLHDQVERACTAGTQGVQDLQCALEDYAPLANTAILPTETALLKALSYSEPNQCFKQCMTSLAAACPEPYRKLEFKRDDSREC